MRFWFLSVAWGNGMDDWCQKVTEGFDHMVGVCLAVTIYVCFVLSVMFW